MKKKLFMVLTLCAALILSACGGASGDAPAKGSVAAEAESPSGETKAESPSGEAEAESPYEEPPETEMEAQNGDAFEQLAGTWVADEGFSILTVYANGGFLLDGDEQTEGYLVYTEADGDEQTEGYLVYTEADGEGLWDSGPRYELYLENNERVPDCYFAFDDTNPGRLAYVVGGGAELLSRPDTVYDENGPVLRVLRPDESFFAAFAEVENFVHDDGELSTEIAFRSTRDLQNFQFLSVALEDVNESGAYFTAEELYSLDTLTPERPLLVRTAFPGDMPSIGVSYTDADGVTRYYSVSESGYDGSLVLSGFQRIESQGLG